MKVVCLVSGGLDSCVLAASLAADGDAVRSLSVHYGQRHARELRSAEAVAARLGIPHQLLDLTPLGALLGGSSQTDSRVPVPEGHYADESMRTTVVPNRNMILLAVAVATAIGSRFDAVAYAAHAGDHPVYPDCRPEFVAALRSAVALCDWEPPLLLAPFSGLTKAEVVGRGARLGAPLDLTWSCYVGGELHCGRCGTCVERREAFQLAGVKDPTKYE